MKLQKNNRYFNIAAYTVISCLIVLVGVFILLNFRLVWQWLKEVIELIYVIIEPLLIGLILAYLLDPIVDFYEKRWQSIREKREVHLEGCQQRQGKKRWHVRTVPTLLTFITLMSIMGLFILMIRMNIQQLAIDFSIDELENSITGYVVYFEDMMSGITKFTERMGLVKGQGVIERLYAEVNRLIFYLYNNFTGGILGFGVHAMNWLLACVIAFYLLQDKEHFLSFLQRVLKYSLKQERYLKIRDLGREVDCILSGYIRGQVIDATIIVILTSGALLLIRLDFAIIIGIVAGIFNLIPYFGPIVGLVLSIIIGLLDSNPMKALYGALAILVIQQIDGWFIVPKIVGECVKLHPIVVLLAILIGGNLFGLVGMLIAVPVAAFIRLLLIRFIPELFLSEEK
ncbi:MAG: AI-2E family transporter [Cellulosilyticum sp.]|nr:AI-2E family transporter [Cellulosilyticum sp.]